MFSLINNVQVQCKGEFMNSVSGINHQKKPYFVTRIHVLPEGSFTSLVTKPINPFSEKVTRFIGRVSYNGIAASTVTVIRSPIESALISLGNDPLNSLTKLVDPAEIIKGICKSFRRKSEELTALVIGGDRTNSGSMQSAKTQILALEEEGVNTAVLVGQPRYKACRVEVSHPQNTIYVFPQNPVECLTNPKGHNCLTGSFESVRIPRTSYNLSINNRPADSYPISLGAKGLLV